ncbi:hypothetical protein [Xenorhabdus bovienii]|uniref:Uncharacterized protein n=2 Tax=Xenorhabdus bovienii TaxID=40576 RepID=A0A077NLS7_XENBV|nr:hypothetical protein [Xenorhabdus bovienii]CDG89417.1 hypothetical protein XBFFR1_2520011 [Xenorhabdus bovienii str. feltiae France]CDG94451.1 hypothetical protein XBFFL1_580011 [Xenorhabdus bovienii str. feltiae Florida]CDG98705.1 hypothetical protein XBP1_490005 [Xenorhabdus bovienii str. puntauvense]CDH02281.1 hypothetical protein XBFM1_260009 [Xenorhabdus bovienii str. feltiae Moldova]
MQWNNINKVIVFAMLFIPRMGFSLVDEDLDYCAKKESWVAYKVIEKAVEKNNRLDKHRAVSTLLARHKLKKEKLPITFSEWGQLYSQTTEIVIPFIDNQAPPIALITSSIISAAECSLTEPIYFDITPNSYPKDDTP